MFSRNKNEYTIERLIAIGDIHGCFDQLYELIIIKIGIKKDDKIVLLGDYIDRGPDSKGVLDLIMKLIDEGYDLIPIMGNHEDMMLSARDHRLDILNWSVNGGEKTMLSFNVSSVLDIDEKYFTFLRSMKKYHVHDRYIFVHGGFNDDIDDPFSDEFSMMWDRRFEYKSQVFKDKIIIHGHRPRSLEELRKEISTLPRVINLDTGCVYGRSGAYGYLSGLDMSAMELYYV